MIYCPGMTEDTNSSDFFNLSDHEGKQNILQLSSV